MPAKLHRTWGGLRKSLRDSRTRGCTVTFNYADGSFCTVVAPSFRAACLEATARWGADWIGEPCYSTVDTIYNDLTGWTKQNHGQDFTVDMHTAMRGKRRPRRNRESA